MQKIDKYIIYSSIFALFTEDFSFHYIIDWKLFYIILLSNFLLLATKKKIVINKNIGILLLFFLSHGLLFYLWYQNPLKSLFAQLIGISLSSIYYYNFLSWYGSKLLFEKYLNLALFVAIIAIPMFFLNINVFIYNRLNGIMTEPAHYAAIMLPAVYVFLMRKDYLRLIILTITLFLSNSTIGYLGLVLILLVPLTRSKYFIKYSWIVMLIIGSSIYYLSTQWNKPIDENESNVLVRRLKETNQSLGAIKNGEFKQYTNLSSYAFLSNTFIVKNIIYDKPFGTGLGSYHHEYDKYYSLMTPPPYLLQLKQSKINRTDANSLFLRLIGDLGIFSILLFLLFIYISTLLFKNEKKVFRQGTFFYLIAKLIREGHYFPPEFYFFLLIFLKDFDEDIAHS